VKRCKVEGADSEKQQDLGFLRQVQLKVERINDQEFLQAKTRLDVEQLWFRTSILTTPRTWCKSKTNFYKIWAAQHLCMRDNLVYKSTN
jgi:hypothetical protein